MFKISILYSIIHISGILYLFPTHRGLSRAFTCTVCLSLYYFKIYAMQIWKRSEHCDTI